jgi:putative FmdB family regulatory protein
MPTYEYICQKCGKNFDAYQSMRDEAYKICPKELCRQSKWGKGKVTRLVGTGAGLIFKGSGFYITDYRSNSYKEAAKKDSVSGGEKSGGESAAGQTESKSAPATAPAQKSEAKAKKDSGA